MLFRPGSRDGILKLELTLPLAFQLLDSFYNSLAMGMK